MRLDTEIQYIGSYDYDDKSANMYSEMNVDSFSINIFQWVAMSTSKKKMKPSKCVVCVIGTPSNKAATFAVADSIVDELTAGTYTGGIIFTVKPIKR